MNPIRQRNGLLYALVTVFWAVPFHRNPVDVGERVARQVVQDFVLGPFAVHLEEVAVAVKDVLQSYGTDWRGDESNALFCRPGALTRRSLVPKSAASGTRPTEDAHNGESPAVSQTYSSHSADCNYTCTLAFERKGRADMAQPMPYARAKSHKQEVP